MNNPVMQRQMFMAIGMPSKSPEQGIVSGMESVEGYEDRTPDNIEIIANNLRGDIRSMDERYLELASMVGEAAFETPEEVLALMQVQLQQQTAPQAGAPQQAAPQQNVPTAPPAPSGQPGGIEALVASAAPQPPQPPQGMPPGMPPGPGGIEGLVAPPTEQAPVMRQAGSPPTGERSRVPFNPIKAPSYSEAVQSYGRLAPTNVGGRGVYAQSILDLLKTEAPTSRAGRPIPFVDRSGRMYQPVGGTDPRMASRGAQFLPKSAYGPLPSQLMRMAGPIGYTAGAGYLATEALMASDKSAGELTGDSFGLEFGSSAAGTPDYRYMPGIEPTAAPPAIDQVPSGLAEQIPVAPRVDYLSSPDQTAAETSRLGITPGVVPPITEEVTEEVKEDKTVSADTRLQPPAPKERGLKERAEERYNIYKDLLGDDKNMRQAQALFLLAEAALNVAGAKSKEKGAKGIMERLSTGLKGLPAGMAALGAEASREDRALKASAISATEAEMAAEAKERGLLQRESLKLLSKAAPINDLAGSFKSRFPGYDDSFYTRMAKDYKSGLIKELPDTSELYDVASGKILLSPLNPNDKERVGYLDPEMPFTSTSNKKLSRATNKQRPELIDRISNNESLVQDIENFYKDIMDKNFIGVVPSIQSGLTNITLPFFGENPFSNVPLQQQRNAGLQMNQRLREMAMAYRGRPSNWSEEQVNKYLVDPQEIFKDKSQFFAVLENFRQGAINEINRDYHRLFPDQVPLRQLSQVPLGDKKSPLESKDLKYMGEMFRVNPNREVYVKLPDGTSERVTAESFRTMTGQQ